MIDVTGTNILGTVLGGVTILVTSWRLWYRAHVHQLWWDDAWALAAMFFSIWPWIFSWVIFEPVENNHVSQHTRAVCTYLLAVTFELAIWAARLSILWTIIRLAANRSTRRFLYALGGVFVLFALILSAQKFWVCVPQPGWLDVPGGFCNFGKQVAITEIVTDIIGDTLLIIIPIHMLWSIRITQSIRIRLFCIFGMSILTTTASLAQNYYQIHDGGVNDFIVSHVELQTAVTVCNLNVIMAALSRSLYKKNIDESVGTGVSRDIVTIGGSRANKSAHAASINGTTVHVDTQTWTDSPNYKGRSLHAAEDDYGLNHKDSSFVVTTDDGFLHPGTENYKLADMRRLDA